MRVSFSISLLIVAFFHCWYMAYVLGCAFLLGAVNIVVASFYRGTVYVTVMTYCLCYPNGLLLLCL